MNSRPGNLLRKIFLLFLALVAFSYTASFVSAEEKPADGKYMTKVSAFQEGDFVKAEPFKLIGGGEFDLADYKGKKVVIIAFWLPNCELCFDQLRDLKKFISENDRKKHVVVLTVTKAATREEIAIAKYFIKREKITFPVAMDDDTVIARSFGASQIPFYVAIDKKGRLVSPKVSYPEKKIRDLSFFDYVDVLIADREIPKIQYYPYNCSEKMKKLIGTIPPQFSLESVRGRTFDLSEYKDKMNVVLVFWHPYSQTSLREMKKLIKYYSRYRRDHNFVLLTFVSIYGQSQKDTTAQFIAQNNLSFPVLDDSGSVVGKKYGIEKIPTTFFINKKGRIVEIIESETRIVEKRFNAVFDSLMKD